MAAATIPRNGTTISSTEPRITKNGDINVQAIVPVNGAVLDKPTESSAQDSAKGGPKNGQSHNQQNGNGNQQNGNGIRPGNNKNDGSRAPSGGNDRKSDNASYPTEEKKFSTLCRLFVGNLSQDTTEQDIKNIFGKFTDAIPDVFVGKLCAFVRLDTRANAEKAKHVDGTSFKGRILRVRSATKGCAVKVKNLGPQVSNELLHRAFERFGEIDLAVVAVDEKGRPCGEGLVYFAQKQNAEDAIRLVNDGVYLLGASPRPVVVEFVADKDVEDGMSEIHIASRQQYQNEISEPPHFAKEGSAEYEFGKRWKQWLTDHETQIRQIEHLCQNGNENLEKEMEKTTDDDVEITEIKQTVSLGTLKMGQVGERKTQRRPSGGALHSQPKQQQNTPQKVLQIKTNGKHPSPGLTPVPSPCVTDVSDEQDGVQGPATPGQELTPSKLKQIARKEIRLQKEAERQKKDEVRRAAEEKTKRILEAQQKRMQAFVIVQPKVAPELMENSDLAIFQPYEIQKGVRLAPTLRVPPPSPNRMNALVKILRSDFNPAYATRDKLYIAELKSRRRLPLSSRPTCAPEVTVLSATKVGDPSRFKVKLVHFAENARPPYYGTMRRKSKVIRGRNPFATDLDLLEYDVDSDEEWEEERAAGEADECEEEAKSEDEDEEDNSDWLVEDVEDALKSNDVDTSSGLIDDEDEIVPVRPSVHDWMKQKKFLRLKRRVIGPCWADQENVCPNILRKLSVIIVPQEVEEEMKDGIAHESLGFGLSKIPEKVMPYLIRLLHGSYVKKEQVTDRFLDLLAARNNPDFAAQFPELGISCQEILKTVILPKELSKSLLKNVIKEIAVYTVPSGPEKPVRLGKLWYVSEKVRSYYKTLEGSCLPNSAAVHVVREKRKAGEMESPPPHTPSKTAKVDKASRPSNPPVKICTPVKLCTPDGTVQSPEIGNPRSN